MTGFPEKFIESARALLGDESEALLEALGGQSPVSIRFNPYKVAAKPDGIQVPWCRYGFYLGQRPSFTLDPLFHAGVYYVQEAGSMFIEHALRSAFGDDVEGLRVLDLCAAPGGKTTLLSSLVGLEGLVVANEVIRQRTNILADNVRKWGLGNVVVTNNDPAHFGAMEHWFDAVVVDAPCSGEGMFRKDPDAVGQWSTENVELCAARQRRILSDVWSALRPGGVLIYSTCTFNRLENEQNVEWMLREFDCSRASVSIPDEWGVAAGRVGDIDTFRFFPHRLSSEGFFCAVLRKADDRIRVRLPKPRRKPFGTLPAAVSAEVARWFAQPEYMTFASIGDTVYGYYSARFDDIRTVAESLSAVYSGVAAGTVFKGTLRPEHALALFHDLTADTVPRADLTQEQAVEYLRKGELAADLFDEGTNLVRCDGAALGWAKRIGRRVNNNYPNELRIKHM